jgi:endoribonuclease Dicer
LTLEKGKAIGVNKDDSIRHTLADKSIADICEAIIGAAFFQNNDPRIWTHGCWDDAVRMVTVLVNNSDHKQQMWKDYLKAYRLPKYQVAAPLAWERELALKIQAITGYEFRYPRLLSSAFMHPSNASAITGLPNYQRLEFLGDSLLDMVYVNFLFYRYPDKDPQWLTEHKMAMVSNRFLGALCVKLNFHFSLRYNNSSLRVQIAEYVEDLTSAQQDGEETMDYWLHAREPPKVIILGQKHLSCLLILA